MGKKKVEDLNGVGGSGAVVVTKHEELPTEASLMKRCKAELVEMLLDALSRMNDAVDTVALRDAKISGLEFRVENLGKERDAFKTIADNTDKIVGDMRSSLEKAKGDVSMARKACDANKMLVEELTNQVKLVNAMYERDVDELKGELERLKCRSFFQRLFNK